MLFLPTPRWQALRRAARQLMRLYIIPLEVE